MEMIDNYKFPESIYHYNSNNLSDLEQSMLHPWEVKLLDKIKKYEKI
jgi:hypothetical protein